MVWFHASVGYLHTVWHPPWVKTLAKISFTAVRSETDPSLSIPGCARDAIQEIRSWRIRGSGRRIEEGIVSRVET